MDGNKTKDTQMKENSELTLVAVDSPDDFKYEGQMEGNAAEAENAASHAKGNLSRKNSGDEAYVTIDNPDDFE